MERIDKFFWCPYGLFSKIGHFRSEKKENKETVLWNYSQAWVIPYFYFFYGKFIFDYIIYNF